MAFENIIGNERVKSVMARALRRQRLPYSLLFIGQEGVGKYEAAMVVAKALNCLNRTDDACEECSSCLAINRRNFPDVMVFEPENDVHRIEQMRILKSTAYLRPMVGKKRVFIITDAERMMEPAANSLLKILEETPPFSHIILLTSNPYLIIPTIQSRCQILRFTPVFSEEIEKILKDRGCEDDRAKVVSQLVEGNLKMALALDWDELQEKRQRGWQFFISLLKKENISPLLREFVSSRFPGKQELGEVFETLASFCRDVVLIKGGGDGSLVQNLDFGPELQEAAGWLSLESALDLMGKIDYSLYALKKNCNVRLLVCFFFTSFLVRESD
jgi:DNA polymerase III delta' subunit